MSVKIVNGVITLTPAQYAQKGIVSLSSLATTELPSKTSEIIDLLNKSNLRAEAALKDAQTLKTRLDQMSAALKKAELEASQVTPSKAMPLPAPPSAEITPIHFPAQSKGTNKTATCLVLGAAIAGVMFLISKKSSITS